MDLSYLYHCDSGPGTACYPHICVRVTMDLEYYIGSFDLVNLFKQLSRVMMIRA
jgi:hypothetical protein